MSYLVSHVFFILLLLFTTINPWLPVYKWTNLLPPFHEWLLLLWFCGILSTTLSNPPDKAGFGSIKLVNLFIGFAAILVHFIGIFLPNNLIPYILFTRNQLFALVLLLSFVELLNFLTFHHLFGPWAVIIQDLVKDMMRFLVIMGIFLIGFTLTVSVIYVPVFEPPLTQQQQVTTGAADELINRLHSKAPSRNQHQVEQPTNEQALIQIQQHVPSVGIEFQSPLFIFEMLFYSLFGLVEPDLMPPMHSSPSSSKIIMKLVFGVYMMITVIVLINLLIAMMSNTYQRIEARSDIEWKFGRAKLIRNMIRTSPTPSPLILLVGIWIDYYRDWIKRKEKKKMTEEIAISAFKMKTKTKTKIKKKRNKGKDNKMGENVASSETDSVSYSDEIALKVARIWMSKVDCLKHRYKIDQVVSVNREDKNENKENGGSKVQANCSQLQIPADSTSQALQINQVLYWPEVAQKYWDSIGVSLEKDKEILSEQQASNRTIE